MSVKSDFFSNTNPDLISNKSINDLNDAIIVSDALKKSSTLTSSSISMYKKYIKPNLIPIIILICFLSFMIYKYMTKKIETEKTENFDPNKSINDPKQYKLNLHETSNHHDLDNVINSIVLKNEIDEILNDDSLYDNLYKPDINDRVEYTGTKNKFKNQKIIKTDHPLGYDDNFIEIDNNMLDFATTQNKSKVDIASSMLFN